ncbi:MAG: Cell wall-associated hydrolase [uncultured bacterium]|uniref:Cell wall-associated hydrolase n=1 Tax=Candidatus Daviesbacteria bacterium GW2011_GWC2_40_12 TaxID=1618431 RepID=A0A0G0QML3_9BACT|nr:MAG: Cell wall-associated hydrolase [uncultured bacterium]KKQ85545.1 MAG: Cell wall-associated hydrolase [Candidatus Daviesbacteria bacterium GW2011_GWF2_38_7]KKR16071.1 MAG: Cell wall-associated hydrolase [Candidatus Daviesbacteria bacterium GW2011_GWA2_39_33]KKR41639.1 MAG: Cell wall-associated hydrolase [Candidatus Daviesbacteria bacterium GW2011_GWC2_40_12]OGE22184.1 MAG: hypothetical protein A2778_03500 [Candidatus Daviesbacteria bacterium RIFCSPHIGHO2_01_FULL_40_24]OGE29932.1 MAG: hyp
MVLILDEFLKIPYNAKRYPRKKRVIDVFKGANCQLFVYEFLRCNGYDIPFDYRSSGLWEDQKFTKRVKSLKPFDILFFNKTSNSYGAHLGIYIGSDKVIHLSRVAGYAAVWGMEEFKKYDRYKYFLGAKRLKQKKV